MARHSFRLLIVLLVCGALIGCGKKPEQGNKPGAAKKLYKIGFCICNR